MDMDGSEPAVAAFSASCKIFRKFYGDCCKISVRQLNSGSLDVCRERTVRMSRSQRFITAAVIQSAAEARLLMKFTQSRDCSFALQLSNSTQ